MAPASPGLDANGRASRGGEDEYSVRALLDGVEWNAGGRNRERHGSPVWTAERAVVPRKGPASLP